MRKRLYAALLLLIFAAVLGCAKEGKRPYRIGLVNFVTGKVLIIGAGTIGLIMLQLAQLRGASEVIVLDPLQFKRDMAASLNADHVFNPSNDKTDEKIFDITSGGADTIIECVGSQNAGESAVKFSKKGGKVVIFGLANSSAVINIYMQSFFHKELTLKSSILNPNTF